MIWFIRKADNDDFIILEMMSLVQSHYLRKGSPDQPRDDHGRWTSGGESGTINGAQSSNELVQNGDDGSFDVAITAQDHLSKNCLGSVKSVFPGQFLDMEIAEIRKLVKEGDAAARRACKIIDQGRFKK